MGGSRETFEESGPKAVDKMFISEFEAKRLIAERGIPIPEGQAVSDPKAAAVIARRIRGPLAIKAQILGGGRGKAGGIRFATGAREAQEAARMLLGSNLKGQVVEKVLVEQRLRVLEELYVAVVSDASRRCPLVLYSASGGMDIEEVAEASPDRVCRFWVDILKGFCYRDAMDLLAGETLPENVLTAVASVMEKLYDIYRTVDAQLLEINPLAVLESGEVVALDCKLVIDDNGLKRRSAVLTETEPGIPLEVEARNAGLTYIELQGDIAILANGAGLTMATMDLVSHFGGKPANFMEVGGGAYRKAREALSIVLAHPTVKSLFINIFGAFARADVIADGLTSALGDLKPKIPVTICIRGTEEEIAREMVRSRLGIEPYTEMEEAAREAVLLAKQNAFDAGEGRGFATG